MVSLLGLAEEDEMIRSNSRFIAVLTAIGLALAMSGFALADETEGEEDSGSPWSQEGIDWRPGAGGPPPWADDTDEGDDDVGDIDVAQIDDGDDDDGNDDDEGPRWLRDDAAGWLPGDGGPPPWSNARWLRDDADGWQPGDGKPPWANGDDGDDGDDDDGDDDGDDDEDDDDEDDDDEDGDESDDDDE